MSANKSPPPLPGKAPPIASTSLSSTTQELFVIWLQKCKSRKSTKGADMLEHEARSFFQSLARGVSIMSENNSGSEQKVLKTKSSHQKALATLLQTFQPLWSSENENTHQTLLPRFHALSTLYGALQGCGELSLQSMSLFGKFLLPHIGPIDTTAAVDFMSTQALSGNNSGYIIEQDLDEQVRDVALKSMTALLACEIDQLNDDVETKVIIELRLQLAQSSLEYRCSVVSNDGDDTNGDYMIDTSTYSQEHMMQQSITQGLSKLPRLRRSLCFDVIQSAVKASGHDLHSNKATAIKDSDVIVKFNKFVPNLLLGESDPRCLLQILTLFSDTLQQLSPVYKAQTIKGGDLFIGDYFDAIAPYYPIQFTPPPNNPHGITKKHLQNAIVLVMSCTQYDEMAKKSGQDGMLVLSVGLILDTLLPPPEDDPVTYTEQESGLKDLAYLLLQSNQNDRHKNLEKLDERALQSLSDVLYTLHNESSLAVATKQGTDDAVYAKSVADTCRDLISRLALACETSREKTLWKTFVAKKLQSLSSQMTSNASASSEVRTAMAFVACLCACGGPRTLELSLDKGLSPLLEKLLQGMQDDNDLTSAIFGIGALFSSTNVALDKMDIEVYPHPLEPYTASAMDKLCSVFSASSALPVRVAAAQAIEALLYAAPANQFGQDQIIKLRTFMQDVANVLIEDREDEIDQDDKQWLKTCADIIGRILGRTFSESSSVSISNTLLQDTNIQAYVQEYILSSLLLALSKDQAVETRFDLQALASASTISETISRQIAQRLLDIVNIQDVQSEDRSRLECVQYFLVNGGSDIARILQADEAESDYLLTCILNLCKYEDKQQKQSDVSSLRISNTLEVPTSLQDTATFEQRLNSVLSIVPYLVPIYKQYVSESHVSALMRHLSNCMPPLTASDTFKVSVILPFLASALLHSEYKDMKNAEWLDNINASTSSIMTDLLDFALAPDLNLSAQGSAIQCVSALLATFVQQEDNSCPVLALVRSSLFPLLLSSLQSASDCKTKKGIDILTMNIEMRKLQHDVMNILMICGVLASAALARNNPVSLQTTDTLSTFFVDLACCGKADDLISEGTGPIIDLEVFDRPGQVLSHGLYFAAASAFGTILSSQSGNALWKQRLMFTAIRRMQAGDTELNPGSLGIVCHMICSCDSSVVGDDNAMYLSDFVVQGFSATALLLFENLKTSVGVAMPTEVKKILLAAALKLMSQRDHTLTSQLYNIVIGVLRLYASLSTTEDADIVCKILALQLLAVASQIESSKEMILTLQPALVSILGVAVREKHALLRSAAIEVRSLWCIVE